MAREFGLSPIVLNEASNSNKIEIINMNLIEEMKEYVLDSSVFYFFVNNKKFDKGAFIDIFSVEELEDLIRFEFVFELEDGLEYCGPNPAENLELPLLTDEQTHVFGFDKTIGDFFHDWCGKCRCLIYGTEEPDIVSPEYDYMLRDEVWKEAIQDTYHSKDVLCISCVETLLGRKLKSDDFNFDIKLNDPDRWRSERLKERMGYSYNKNWLNDKDKYDPTSNLDDLLDALKTTEDPFSVLSSVSDEMYEKALGFDRDEIERIGSSLEKVFEDEDFPVFNAESVTPEDLDLSTKDFEKLRSVNQTDFKYLVCNGDIFNTDELVIMRIANFIYG